MQVLVVGSGLLGLTTAFYLARAGCEVRVVDRAEGPGRATSYANGGMLHASQANPWNEPGVTGLLLRSLGREDAAVLVRLRALPALLGWGLRFLQQSQPARYLRNFEKNAHLARYSLSLMPELRAALDGDYHYAACGTLKLFRQPRAFAAAGEFGRQLEAWNIPYELVDARRAVELEPALAPIARDLAGGVYFPADEAGDAQRFCELLTAACRRLGVRFDFGIDIDRLLRRGSRLEGVLGSSGLLTAEAYVLAAGPWSPLLAQGVGLALPVRPAKGYSITVPLGDWREPPRLPVIDDSLHAAVCPLGDRLRVAGTAEFAGYDLTLTPSRIDNLYSLVTRLYPAFAPHLDRRVSLPWCGLRPMSADGVGLMGRTPLDNLYLNTGHGPLGWTMAAGAGRLVADEITGRTPALPLAPYRLERAA